jgi:phage baseplate assembly protein W
LADLVPVGIQMPYRNGNTGYFVQTYSDLERAHNNLKMLLMTMQGERPMMPTYGSSLHEILFENNVSGFSDDLLEDSVKEATEVWMPEVHIKSVTTNRELNVLPNTVSVTIKFSVINIPDSAQELTLEIDA